MEWMPKTLFDAMLVLARTHTRDDDQVGFTLQSAPILFRELAGMVRDDLRRMAPDKEGE